MEVRREGWETGKLVVGQAEAALGAWGKWTEGDKARHGVGLCAPLACAVLGGRQGFGARQAGEFSEPGGWYRAAHRRAGALD